MIETAERGAVEHMTMRVGSLLTAGAAHFRAA